MIKPPFPAYRGSEKYIFISYAHKDNENVFPAIQALQSSGYRIWYDEGIEAGDDWSGTIADHLERAEAVLYFMSKNTASNANVKRELALAAEKHIPVLTVIIGKFRLTAEQEKQTTVNQFVRMDSFKTYADLALGLNSGLSHYDVSCNNPDTVCDLSGKSLRIRFKNAKRKKAFLIFAVAAIILFVVFLGFRFLFKTVPAVVGMKTDDALQAVSDAGFQSALSLNYSDKYEFGTIFEQSSEGSTLRFVPVVVTQSLGPEENLTDVPQVVGFEISDGAKVLIEAGLKKFTVVPEFESKAETGFISAQSIPAGLRVSRNNLISIDVRTDGGEYSFTVDGRQYTIAGDKPLLIDVSEESELSDSAPLSLQHPDQFKMTDGEWTLFYANNKHSIWNPDEFVNVWLPAAMTSTIENHPDECYGWVIVRDMTIDAKDLFAGYSELYVCPGITLTVTGNVTDTDSLNDYYVAPGAKLIFEDEVNGGVYLVNDGTTEFRKNLKGGNDGVLIGNRGNINVSGIIGKGVSLWGFYESFVSGTDETGGTLHDYSPYRQVDASNWYEGCSGENGFWMLTEKLETFAGYSYESDRKGQYGITPVIKPEDFEAHWDEGWYSCMFLFLSDYTVEHCAVHQGESFMLIAAPGVTLTIDDQSGNYGPSVFADKGSTVIINCDIKGYWPYSPYFINDGTIILNGNFIPKDSDGGCRSILMNRGEFIANGKFGGSGMYCFNFAGASFTGNILSDTYVQNLDFTPDYNPYDNGYGGALWYNEQVLVKQYGYKNYQHPDEQ